MMGAVRTMATTPSYILAQALTHGNGSVIRTYMYHANTVVRDSLYTLYMCSYATALGFFPFQLAY